MAENARFEAKQELAVIQKTMTAYMDKKVTEMNKEQDDLKIYEEEARVDVIKIQQSYEANKEAVMIMLMERIMNVELEIPKVVIGNFEKNLD